ncbi:MAG: hypothetical protein JWP08_2878, partial [Bryobacterales bacterium]|nr:hypothetical protein [Bryobacterales bacterium]
MALFTDDAVVTLDDLLPFEASLAQVAASHGINVDTKIGLSLSNIGNKLLMWLYSVRASDPQWLTRRHLGLSTVVVTPTLHSWICFEALTRFFAEAYNVQLNTRFQGKWAEYQKEASEAAASLFMSGVGLVHNPLPRPQLPLVSVQDGTAAAQAIFVQTTWVDARGHESALSAVNGQVLSGASSIVVGMAEGAIAVPTSAVGWNIYASQTQTGLSLQNLAPMPIGSTWQLPAT